jgi:hypothetical protein
MALETLFFTYSSNVPGPNNQQISDAIGKLFDYLKQPANYQPSDVSAQMKNINQLLKNNRQ